MHFFVGWCLPNGKKTIQYVLMIFEQHLQFWKHIDVSFFSLNSRQFNKIVGKITSKTITTINTRALMFTHVQSIVFVWRCYCCRALLILFSDYGIYFLLTQQLFCTHTHKRGAFSLHRITTTYYGERTNERTVDCSHPSIGNLFTVVWYFCLPFDVM